MGKDVSRNWKAEDNTRHCRNHFPYGQVGTSCAYQAFRLRVGGRTLKPSDPTATSWPRVTSRTKLFLRSRAGLDEKSFRLARSKQRRHTRRAMPIRLSCNR
jgi:hypothetical protein